jgi:hypothetical protein
MRRRYQAWALAALVALGMAGTAWAGWYASGAVSVTSTNTTKVITNNHSGGDGAAFSASYVLIRSASTSANTCFFDPTDGVATTADTRLEPGATISFPWPEVSGTSGGYASIGMICAAAETATFYITAIR